MIVAETNVKIPFLWGKTAFRKRFWSGVNLIVGPNGSGKTLLAQELARQLQETGRAVTFLRSDRLDEDKFLPVLKANPEITKRIETVLSNMFGKLIRFDGDEAPLVVNKARNAEYSLKDGECHGLRKIITLLAALYSSDGGFLFLDEPELHLHPQLQLFFMSEIRRAAAERGCVFFLITHSPFFIDLRFPADLTGVVVCHVNRAPTHIEKLSAGDASLFRRFLPRFNTYHKQFFFSDSQIFVEGYTDKQIFENLLYCAENPYDSAGTGVIDVGGKDELGVFFKVCALLGTDGRIITDLDALFCGKLREELCADSRPAEWLERQYEKQLPFYRALFGESSDPESVTLADLIERLETYLCDAGRAVLEAAAELPPDLALFRGRLQELSADHANAEALDTYKTVILQGIFATGNTFRDYLPLPVAKTVSLIKNLFALITAAAETARVYILPRGCIEHYYTQNTVSYMPVSAKDRLFHTELEHILSSSQSALRLEYAELIDILEHACSR